MSATPERRPPVNQAPAGTVTFAFTDIEGSTARWERHHDAMRDALRRHDEILYAAMEHHRGHVFKTVGDAFCTAFNHPQDAIEALIEAQRRLSREDFSAVDGLRIRAAVHTGEVDQRNADYFGPTVNRVARLLAVAHGGQIVVSEVAGTLAGDALPPEVALRDLGRHRLKDLSEPEHIFQILAPDLPADFPPLRSLETLLNNLPIALTSFVGRDDEVAEIARLLSIHRLVTVLGAGGVGKTRTTLQIGANVLDDMPDGVWFIELAPLANGSLIPAAIAQAMNFALDDGRLESVATVLQTKRALLIFDNCEHIAPEAGRAIAHLLRTCKTVRVLASSREALKVAGEFTYRMPSLGSPPPDAGEMTAVAAVSWPAVALFTDRAAAADNRFVLSDENAPIVADICRRLDGIPFAIELAAARVSVLAPGQLRDRLNERFRLLTGGRRDELPHHQTLRALIDWSYDLLHERERSLLRRLSIFPDAFSLEAATGVCSGAGLDEADVLDVLESLVDKSLVFTEPFGESMRYRLLQTTLAYAREKLDDADETNATADSHAAYFSALAASAYEEFDSRMPQGWLDRLRPDLDDFRSALHWTLEGGGDRRGGARLAADSAPIFLRLALLREGLRWCDAARAIDGVEPAVAGRIEYMASMLFNNLGANADSLSCARRAVEFYGRSNDERGAIRALSQLAQKCSAFGRFDEARPLTEDAIRRARRLAEPRVLASVLRRCGVSLPVGEIEASREYFAEALRVARGASDADEAGNVLEWWATREAAAGSFERAVELAIEALASPDEDAELFRRSLIASCLIALGRFDEAAPHARRQLSLARQVRHSLMIADAVLHCAPEQSRRDPRKAAMLLGYGRAQLHDHGDASSLDEKVAMENTVRLIEPRIPVSDFAALMQRGGAWNEEEALHALESGLAV